MCVCALRTQDSLHLHLIIVLARGANFHGPRLTKRRNAKTFITVVTAASASSRPTCAATAAR
jgi:hypothetical protein